MRQDCRERRAQFIDTSSRIREAFSFAHPVEQILAVEKYCTAVYGSSLWDLGGQEAGMMVSAWRTGHKLAWDVPRNCHTYLVDEVLTVGVANLEASLLLRFHGFFQGLIASPSHEVAVVALLAARDRRSTLGSNLTRLQNLTGLDPCPGWLADARSRLHCSWPQGGKCQSLTSGGQCCCKSCSPHAWRHTTRQTRRRRSGSPPSSPPSSPAELV